MNIKMRTDGGPAFPYQSNDEVAGFVFDGMSLRDYFASHALHSLYDRGLAHIDIEVNARTAYVAADALLKARETL